MTILNPNLVVMMNDGVDVALKGKLFIKKSHIPLAGKGLFTKVPIAKGTRIIEYVGEVTTWEEADHDDGENAYIYYLNKNHVINAKDHKQSLARYANDARGLKKVKSMNNNAAYLVEKKRVFIEAIKPIDAGAEILVAYGKEYWDVIKKNFNL